MAEGDENGPAILALGVNRFFYSINWYAIAATFFLIAPDLHAEVSGLGLVTSAFLISVGLFQLPAGILAARLGSRNLCILGMAVASVSTLLSGAVAQLTALVALRFVCGIGMAMFFSPSLTVWTRHMPRGKVGSGLGLYYAVTALGSAAGLFGLVLVGEAAGWRSSLALVGVLGLVSAALMAWKVPPDRPEKASSPSWPELRAVLSDRWLLVVSLALLGTYISSSLVGTFVVVYLHGSLGMPAASAGAIGGLFLLTGLVGAPLAGRLHDRYQNTKRLLIGIGGVVAVGMVLASVPSTVAVLSAAIIVGLGNAAGITVSFAAVQVAGGLSQEHRVIASSWMNFIQLFAGFWAPSLFSYTTVVYGYPSAWLTSALYPILLVVPALAFRKKDTMRSSSTNPQAGSHRP